MKLSLRKRFLLWNEKRKDDGQLRWAAWMDRDVLLEILKKDNPKDNECYKTLEHIELRKDGKIYMEGLQYLIIDGKVIKEES